MDGNGQDAYDLQPALSGAEGSAIRDPRSEIRNPKSEIEMILARRAARLAQAPDEEDKGEQVELALIRLGREVYGLDVQYVFEIRPLERLTPVPRTPEWVAGVVNLRGRILSVLDLQRFLGLPGRNQVSGETGFLVVVETPDMELALLANEVLAIETVPTSKIQEAANAVRGIRPEYVRGVVTRNRKADRDRDEDRDGEGASHVEDNGSLLVILDLPALLADKQLIVHEEIT